MQFDICPGCMGKLSAPGPCPKCGFDAAAYQPKPHQLAPCTILNGKYLIGRVLGQGGFGITYIGRDMTLELTVAIKEYFPAGFVSRDCAVGTAVDCVGGQQAQDFFLSGKQKSLNEARTMAKCDGIPEIVRVRDFFEANNTVYIIMDYIEGVTVQKYLRSKGGRISMNECISLLGPVIRAMDTVHKQFGLIHRDISPDNIMVLPDGRTRLLDFGAAKSSAPSGNTTVALTLKRGLSPIEQYSGSGGQGPWTDVYAFAATIYYCITGTLPPEATGRIEADTLVPPVRLGAVISREQETALMRALAIRPADRFQSMRDFYLALTARPQAQPVYGAPVNNVVRSTPPQAYSAPVQPVQHPTAAAYPQAVNVSAAPQPMQTVPGRQQVQVTHPVQVMHGTHSSGKKGNAGLIAGIAAILVIAAVGIGILVSGGSKKDDTTLHSSMPQADKYEDKADEGDEIDQTASLGTQDGQADEQSSQATADTEVPAAAEDEVASEPAQEPTEEPAEEPEPVVVYDPQETCLANNILNGNFLFSVEGTGHENTIYYCNDDLAPYLENDNGVFTLNDGEGVLYINYTDDYLYFVDFSGSAARICRTDHSGGDKTVLYSTTGSIMNLNWYNGALYYCEDDSMVCRLSESGSRQVLYSGGTVDEMVCWKGGIYWLDNKGNLMTMPVDGGEASLLYGGGTVYFFQFCDDLLYCVRDYDMAVLSMDGRVVDTLAISTYYFNIYDGVLYYSDYDDHGIYAYDLSTGRTEKLMDDPGGNPLRLCVGRFNGRVILWFFYNDSEGELRTAVIVENEPDWAFAYISELLG